MNETRGMCSRYTFDTGYGMDNAIMNEVHKVHEVGARDIGYVSYE